LPREAEETEPAFIHFDADALPARTIGGARVRLIAGSAFGATSPVRTHSRLFYVHAELDGDASLEMPHDYSERAIFVAAGRAILESATIDAGQMAVLSPNTPVSIRAIGPTTLMMLGGEPVGTRHIYWNFVSSSAERIDQAKADWRAGKLPLPVDDDQEFIPLPDDPPASAPAMS
jgi:redox-sensitive bicupin YhaK (pirin superfamily)